MAPHRTCSAYELLDLLLDRGSYASWDGPIDVSGHPIDYRLQLQEAARRAGTDEAVLTGRGSISGRPVAMIISEFAFLGGSIGCAAADRITGAVRRATAEGLPLFASTASGGTRMQEGTPAFVGMMVICRALMEHRAARLPYLVHLRHPTTGGVYASWGSLGQLTVAEPGALVGFLGPKVFRALRGESFPEGVQTAENLAAHGLSTPSSRPTTSRRSSTGRSASSWIHPAGPGWTHARPTSAADRPGPRSSRPAVRTGPASVSCCGTVPDRHSRWAGPTRAGATRRSSSP